MRVLVLHGPNLNWLGRREPSVYGTMTLAELNEMLGQRAAEAHCELLTHQSNSEGELIDCLQEQADKVDGIVINPGALTHYSFSLRDALVALDVPVIEVHLSNIHAREAFRKTDVVADAVKGQVIGLGWRSYTAALDVLMEWARERVETSRNSTQSSTTGGSQI